MNKWLISAVLGLSIITAAVGLRSVASYFAATTGPMPPSPWIAAATTGPMPPSPWIASATTGPMPPSPW